jgi:hypothetical protein
LKLLNNDLKGGTSYPVVEAAVVALHAGWHERVIPVGRSVT